MALHIESAPGVFTPWDGKPIDGIIYAPNIGAIWTPEDLAAVGLYEPVDPGFPDGKIVTGTSVQRVEGIVQFVYELEDAPAPSPADFPLSDRQLRLGLVLNGIGLSTIDAAIASIADPVERATAEIWWDRSTRIEWDHPMTQALMGLVGVSPEDAATMWMAAKDYAA